MWEYIPYNKREAQNNEKTFEIYSSIKESS